MNSAHIPSEMKIGIPVWDNRVSPLLDTAGQLLMVNVEQEKRLPREVVNIPLQPPWQRARYIHDAGVGTLICGAVSRPLESMLIAAGITVIPWIRGEIEEIIAAYSAGTLDKSSYQLPGCCRRRGRHRSGRRHQPRGGFGQYRQFLRRRDENCDFF